MILEWFIVVVLASYLTPDLVKSVLNLVKSAGNYAEAGLKIAGQAIGVRPTTPEGEEIIGVFNRVILWIRSKWDAFKLVGEILLAVDVLLFLGWAIGCLTDNVLLVLGCGIALSLVHFALFLIVKATGELFGSKEVQGYMIAISALFILSATMWKFYIGFHGGTALGVENMNGLVFLGAEAIAIGLKIYSEALGKSRSMAAAFHFSILLVAIIGGMGLKTFAADAREIDAAKMKRDKARSEQAARLEQDAYNRYGVITRPAIVWDLTLDDTGKKATSKTQRPDPTIAGKTWVLPVGTKIRFKDEQIHLVSAGGSYTEVLLQIDGTDEYPIADPTKRLHIDAEKIDEKDVNRFAKAVVNRFVFDVPANKPWAYELPEDLTDKYVRVSVRGEWSNGGEDPIYFSADGLKPAPGDGKTLIPKLLVPGAVLGQFCVKNESNPSGLAIGTRFDGYIGKGKSSFGMNDVAKPKEAYDDNLNRVHVIIEVLE